MAEVILVVAVNKKGEKSEPFKMYQTKAGALKGQFVMKVEDAGVNDNGTTQTKVGNFSLGLIGTNGAEYMDSKLSGFRRKSNDDVFIVAEKFSETMSTVKELAESEEF
tara:strand:+ start:399 stop:722 length:324 start_codon:yes stop_codon:yes gene_type:complete